MMTNKPAKKVHVFWGNLGTAVALAAGVVEALLLARLVARLLAARPDNPSFVLLDALTAPLVASLAALNYDQPPYGAALEFSTLVMAMIVPVVGYGVWALARRAATSGARETS
jgi:hypothetical protein